jgi:hypothetical protein
MAELEEASTCIKLPWLLSVKQAVPVVVNQR